MMPSAMTFMRICGAANQVMSCHQCSGRKARPSAEAPSVYALHDASIRPERPVRSIVTMASRMTRVGMTVSSPPIERSHQAPHSRKRVCCPAEKPLTRGRWSVGFGNRARPSSVIINNKRSAGDEEADSSSLRTCRYCAHRCRSGCGVGWVRNPDGDISPYTSGGFRYPDRSQSKISPQPFRPADKLFTIAIPVADVGLPKSPHGR